jgi:hypothetical protein
MVEAGTRSVPLETTTWEIDEGLLRGSQPATASTPRPRCAAAEIAQMGDRDDHSRLRDLTHEVFAELLREDESRGYLHVGKGVQA